MGHFSFTCSVSGLAITGRTRVRCLLINESPYGNDGGGDHRDAWTVRTLPIRAKYNEYGSIADIHPDDKFIADLWLRGLREDRVEKGDSAFKKDLTFEALLEDLRNSKVEVRQDVEHYWRRPLIEESVAPCWVDSMRAQIAKHLNPLDKVYTVDEPVQNLVRIRSQHGIDALQAAGDLLAKAGFVPTLAPLAERAGNGVSLIVVNALHSGNGNGIQWDRRGYFKNKTIAVRIAMVREDIWQALINYPTHRYSGISFSKEIEHLIAPPRSGYPARVWYGLEGYKSEIRAAWKHILGYFDKQDRLARGEVIQEKETTGADAKTNCLIDSIRKYRAKDAERIAALPEEERMQEEAKRLASDAAWKKREIAIRENPIFGDYLISDQILPSNNPGRWAFRSVVPGVLGVSEHFSMCLADKLEVPSAVIDRVAELTAFQYAMPGIGAVWKPADSTGLQDPRWGEYVRFYKTCTKIAQEEAIDYDEELLPSSMKEVFKRYGARAKGTAKDAKKTKKKKK